MTSLYNKNCLEVTGQIYEKSDRHMYGQMELNLHNERYKALIRILTVLVLVRK